MAGTASVSNRLDEDVEALIAAAKSGSNDAVGDLSTAYHDYLTVISKMGLGDDLQAKVAVSDVVQETLLDVHRNITAFRGTTEPQFRVWVHEILKMKLVGMRRRFQWTRKRDLKREETRFEAPERNSQLARAIADSRTPSRVAASNEEEMVVQQILSGLPQHYRQVIILRNLELQSFNQIGRAMNRSPNAVRLLWSRAMEHAQREFNQKHARRRSS